MKRRDFIRNLALGGAAGAFMPQVGWSRTVRKAGKGNAVTVLAVGDLILDAPPPMEKYFDPALAVMRGGDVVIGNVEVPHTRHDSWSNPEAHSIPGADPDNLNALPYAGFNVATFIGNHTFDQGAVGVRDTLDKLRSLGIKTAGAGMNIDEARVPATIEKKGMKIAVLGYNATGPEWVMATPSKAGAAYVRVVTTYVNDKANPGGAPSSVYTIVDPPGMRRIEADIRAARETHDAVIVAYHLGRPGAPEILDYQTELTHRAIDAGAEMVVGAHTHALLGVEVYRDKPIFHGLGNWVTLTSVFEPDAPNAAQWNHYPFNDRATRPAPTPGYVPGPPLRRGADVPLYAFDEPSRNTMIAKAVIGKDGLIEGRFVPCYIDDIGAPVPKPRDNGGQKVLDYIVGLTRAAGLDTKFEWSEDGSEVIVS